ncbi:hypothetical protein [Nocardia wallacei]|uniref:hypothetical protein n=1 Tax=Nocardia wallacei TaxID=480035 RepID=UPI00245473BA|nr:hypothetical protein [Nocardia wallacei]
MGKRKYTPEEIAEFKAADEARYDKADAALEDPDYIAGIVGHASGLVCARLLRYSLRNLALIYKQAEELGITVTDIDSAKGWRLRGRRVNQPPLRIVAPGKKRDKRHDTSPDGDAADDSDDQNGSSTDNRRPRFRMISVYDISQTVPDEEFADEPAEPEPVEDPTAVLWQTLTREAERLGYTVDTTADADAAVDEQSATITVGSGRPAQQLAQLLGPIVAHRSRTRHAARQDDNANEEPGSVLLDLGPLGFARAQLDTDIEHAASRYRVRGPKFTGTVTVLIDDAALSQELRRVHVVFGADDGTDRYQYRSKERPDLPVVNGVQVCGGTVLALDNVDNLDGWRINCQRVRGGSAPGKTADRAAAIVRAILAHYITRDDRPQLWRAAVAIDARKRQRTENAEAAKLAAEIENLTAKQRALEAAAAKYGARAYTSDHANTAAAS